MKIESKVHRVVTEKDYVLNEVSCGKCGKVLMATIDLTVYSSDLIFPLQVECANTSRHILTPREFGEDANAKVTGRGMTELEIEDYKNRFRL